MSRPSSPYRDLHGTAHPIAQVKHPVALDNYAWVFQQVLRVDGAEVALAEPEHDGYDVHAYLVDQACCEQLATDVAGSDHSVHPEARALLQENLDQETHTSEELYTKLREIVG